MAVSQTSVSKPNISTNQGKKKKITESHSRSDTAQQPEQQISQPPCSSPSKRTKSPGVRVVRGRIYDSENGKTCHQCRQKTRDFTASCKNQKNNKPCTIKFCHKCLLNRYGEKAEEVALLDDWTCPKCRGICNCSFCMKKRGHRPTGILVHMAKATGFSSVSEMLHVKGPENFGVEKILEDASASPNARASPNKKPVAVPAKNRGKENSFNGKSDSNLQSTPLKSNVDGKKIGESKRKKLRLDDGNNNACEGGKDSGPILEKSPKKSRISVEISKKPIKKEGKISGNDIECKDQNKNSQLQISEKIPVEPTKKERKKDETNVPNNGNTENIVAKPKLARKLKKKTLRIYEKDTGVDVQLPQGIDLTTLAGIDLPAEDVGHALQFLEFCAAFGEVLDLKKGQPESIIRELSRGRSGRRGQYSSIVRFHTQLLSLIQKDSGEESPLSPTSSGSSWLQALGKCISESQYASKELLSNSLDRGSDGYDKLDISQKLRVLNFLCDETLGTVDMRNWIDEQNSKFVEREKEAKGKVIAAKDKEKRMKQKLQDEVAKVILLKNSAPLSISEHEDLVSKIKTETAKVHAETLEAINMVPKKKQRLDAVRTEPILLGDNGCVFWKLQGYSGEPNLLRQDIGSWDMVTPQEKWSTYDVEQKEVVEKYFSSLRRKKFGTMTRMLPLGSCEASTKHDTLDDSSSPTLVVEDSENDHES